MKNLFEIPIYEFINDKFEIVDKTTYEITYLHGKIMKLIIVVNGIQTKEQIILSDHHHSYKSVILKAISFYKNRDLNKNYNIVKKHVKVDQLYNVYNKTIINNIKKHLLPINKELSRDKLTKFKLI